MESIFIWIYKKEKRITLTILVPTLIFFISTGFLFAQGSSVLPNKVKTLVIDAGHGGIDPGALGILAKEKEITLAIALKLGKYIEENLPDVKVYYTRETDIFIPLYERADIANKNKADLFISIHANASPKKFIYGAETYVMGGNKNESNFEIAKTENAVITLEKDHSTKYEGFDPNSTESYIIFSLMQRTHLNQSLNIAEKVQDQFREKARRIDRGVKQAGFLVLWRTGMPSILVETGYISHPDEEKFLISQNGQEFLASAIYRAFKEYKQEIENSSNFENQVNENISINENKKDELYYKVQLFSTKNKLLPDDTIFSKYIEPKEYISGKWYKYAVGSYKSYDEANLKLKVLREKFPGAFIIAIKDSQIIQINQMGNRP